MDPQPLLTTKVEGRRKAPAINPLPQQDFKAQAKETNAETNKNPAALHPSFLPASFGVAPSPGVPYAVYYDPTKPESHYVPQYTLIATPQDPKSPTPFDRSPDASLPVKFYCVGGGENLAPHPALKSLLSWANPPLREVPDRRFTFILPQLYRPNGERVIALLRLLNHRINHFVHDKVDPLSKVSDTRTACALQSLGLLQAFLMFPL